MNNLNDEDVNKLRKYLLLNKPQPPQPATDLEERILMTTVYKKSFIDRLLLLFKSRFLFAVVPIVVCLVFIFLKISSVTQNGSMQEIAVIGEQERVEIVDFMENSWRYSIDEMYEEDIYSENM